MAVAADFLVDLEPALQLGLIVRAEQAGEAPALPRRVRLLGRVLGERDRAAHRQQREAGGNEKASLQTDHGRISLGVAANQLETDGALASPFFASTASAIEAGIGLVFSIKPSSGRTTTRKAK